MHVGIPKEVKNNEYRVAITPAGVHELSRNGHEVYVEVDAGVFVSRFGHNSGTRTSRLGRNEFRAANRENSSRVF